MPFDVEAYNDFPVAVKVFVENRKNSRVSITQQNIIVRLPKFLPDYEKEMRLKAHLDWAKEVIEKKALYQKHQKKLEDYHQKKLEIFQMDFYLAVFEIETGKNKLSYKGNGNIEFYLLKTLDEKVKVSVIQNLLSKFTTKYFISKISERTLHLNDLYFKENIKAIKLNYTTSKWGSCSSKRTIVFSTKLLLLPSNVIDYVIVHELAHLKEMNHSPRFWKWVESAMPDYKKWDKWLSKNGKDFDF